MDPCFCNFTFGDDTYKLPCEDAVNFLSKFDVLKSCSGIHAMNNGIPLVQRYTITQGDKTYTAQYQEAPKVTAAKIKLFMENPNYMPLPPLAHTISFFGTRVTK